ncbi:sodium-dependent phosphate transporter 1-B-like isoform X1 [Diadema setosum]|uniref:sodium-dependent phosphate transporter 1-B-like isoform X1 n=1 Tax=Diadema setosum TaxID=31175 RepID=UPI003B3A78C0
METVSSVATSLLPLTTAGNLLPMSDVLWMVIIGFIISFILSIALGANDVANSFGTSVGAKVLTLYQALFLATIFESLGAVLLGSKVAQTIQKGIFNPDMYVGMEETLLAGEIAALAACAVWLFIATALKMPVSTTHSIVGAMLGFHLVIFQFEGVEWKEIGFIVLSWVTSPVLSGLCSTAIYIIMRYFILTKKEPLEPGLRSLPIWYSLVVIVNFFSIFYDGPEGLGFDLIPLWAVFVISFGSGFVTGLLVWFLVVPHVRRKITAGAQVAAHDENQSIMKKNVAYYSHDDTSLLQASQEMATEDREEDVCNECDSTEPIKGEVKRDEARGRNMEERQTEQSATRENKNSETDDDHPHVRALCSPLQILSAVFAGFAHGGNDVSNAIGPLVSIWLIFQSGNAAQEDPIPLWILFYGATGISLGLWALGRRVIQTVGEDITKLTPSSGFSIELGAAMMVLLASNVGIPISTTHCKIGSVVFVGLVRDRRTVNWSLCGGIVLAWVVTLPVTAGISAAFMALLRLAV